MTGAPEPDRRSLWSNGTAAHVSLRGQVEAEEFRDAEPQLVDVPVADLCAAPGGARDRQLVYGEVLQCLDHRDGWIFGWAARDGYAGWVSSRDLVPPLWEPTHVITAPRSYAKDSPGLKQMGEVMPLPFGSRVAVLEENAGWAQIDHDDRDPWYVPAQHLEPLLARAQDPVRIAQLFLGTPYLWGGNSSFGIDCSGLVQAACLACGVPCPGDSDQQAASLGDPVDFDAPVLPGDLFFWRGHVAMATDAQTLIHANAHHMAVQYEPLQAAIDRISAQGDGPVTGRRRLAEVS